MGWLPLSHPSLRITGIHTSERVGGATPPYRVATAGPALWPTLGEVSNGFKQCWTAMDTSGKDVCVLCSSICRRNPYPSPCTPAKVAAHSCRIKQPYHIWSPQRSVLGPLLYIDGVTSTPLSDGSKMTCHCTDTLKHLRTIKSSKMT